ncbi:MAG TPA: M56 family metallopeptidase [Sedimentisphaerales bacterium]|nr:M56 family metallopeptidase [Sedimentisphaerales bacterium]HRS13042.1 M56 family metallopeptidase [Sedimentisphaerales bacterium]HRV49849.1 M56 family metallopeptidase [Sedimentisphaerales bacterium]
MEWTLGQLNTMGEAFVAFALPMLLISALLIGGALLAEFLLREKARASLRCGLVTAVLIFLALSPFLPLSLPSHFLPSGNAAFADPTTHQAAEHARASLSRPLTGQSQTTTAGTGKPPLSITWQGGLLLLWLGGVVVMSVVVVRRACAACRSVDRSPDANFLMTDILLYCRKRMGIRSKVDLRISAEGTRPAVCGLLRPVIVVPRDLVPSLGSRHLRDVLFHELAHVKRHDLWVNLIQNVVQVVYFYNPFLWVAGAVLRRLRDEAADEAVRETVGDGDRSYSRRLADVQRLTLLPAAADLDLIRVA